MLPGPGEDLGEPVVPAVLGDGRGEVLGLAAVPVGGEHQVPGDGVGRGGPVLPAQQVQAEVEAAWAAPAPVTMGPWST